MISWNDDHLLIEEKRQKAPPRAGFFIGCGVCTSVSYWHLSPSPGFHQNLPASPPHPGTGVHQKGCDLEGVEGATPHTSLTQLTFKTMTNFNTDYNTEPVSYTHLRAHETDS